MLLRLQQQDKTTPAVTQDATPSQAAEAEPLASEWMPQERRAVKEIRSWLDDLAQPRPIRLDAPTLLVLAIVLVSAYQLILAWIQYQDLLHWDAAAMTSLSWSTNALLESNMLLPWVLGMVIPPTLLFKFNRWQMDTQAALQLGHPDLHWIGTLTEALHSPCARQRAAASRLLTRLLPRLRAEDAPLLPPTCRKALYQTLVQNGARDTDLIRAILKALERIGDAEAIPSIETLTYRLAWLPRQRFVRRAALACLAKIEERLAQTGTDTTTSHSDEDTRVIEDAQDEPIASRQNLAALNRFEALMAEVKEDRRKHREPGMRIGYLIASWGVIVPYTGWMTLSSLNQGAWDLGLIWGLLCGLATQLYRLALSSRQTTTLHKLATYDDVRAVGPLAEALDWPDSDVKKVAATALTRLLPRLRASDAGLLNTRQRGKLYQTLTMSNAVRDASFLEAILQALEQVGDEHAVPYVERLIHSAALTRPQKRVRQKAVECLPYLQQRAESQRSSQVLLRPSSAESIPSAGLLRPASGAPEAAPDQLLRASVLERSE